MKNITIQTKAKKRQKKINFIGTFVTNFHRTSNKPYILRDHDEYITNSNRDLIKFIESLQKNQKLELFINAEKAGNIKNLSVEGKILSFDAPFIDTQTQQKETIIETPKTSLEIFCDKWQKFDKNIDSGAILRVVFQVDPRMFQSFNMMSDEEQQEIIKFAGKIIHSKTQEL